MIKPKRRPTLMVRTLLIFSSILSVRGFVPQSVPTTKNVIAFASASDDESTKRTAEPTSFGSSTTNSKQYFYMHPKKSKDEAVDGTQSSSKWTVPVDVDPLIIEENLLSQHTDMESLLTETTRGDTKHIESTSSTSIPYFLEPAPYLHYSSSSSSTSGRTVDEVESFADYVDSKNSTLGEKKNSSDDIENKEISRIAKSIDQSIYQFNTNLVNVLYASISLLYPTSSEKQSQNGPFDFRKRTDTKKLLTPLLGTEYNDDIKTQNDALRFEKFYIFETVARIPYFAYLSVLHLRESLGDRGFQHESVSIHGANEKRVETMRIHYAQADNELHHLLIMEDLGGNSRGFDRFLAHTLAFAYYWFVVLVFLWNEQAAYHLNEIIEDHAYKTYDEFLSAHEEELKALPVPDIARKYYESDYLKNPHLFEEFCAVSKNPCGTHSTCGEDQVVNPRRENRPHELKTLYDVFMNIRDDEKEHWMSLCNIVQYGEMDAVDEANVKSTNGGTMEHGNRAPFDQKLLETAERLW